VDLTALPVAASRGVGIGLARCDPELCSQLSGLSPHPAGRMSEVLVTLFDVWVALRNVQRGDLG
jgi:hypothetical protein